MKTPSRNQIGIVTSSYSSTSTTGVEGRSITILASDPEIVLLKWS